MPTLNMDYFHWFLLIFLCLNPSNARQYYDKSDCVSDQSYPGSRYTCNDASYRDYYSCKTFLVYRANQQFETLSKISALFNVTSTALLRLNNLASASDSLQHGREVLVPISCSCSGWFFRAILSHAVSEPTSLSWIGCGVFEGLVKLLALAEENPGGEETVEAGSTIRVPLKCACPEESEGIIKYLVTYPFVEGDEAALVSKKFGVSAEDLCKVNGLDPMSTVYPGTTVLVPLRGEPVINQHIPGPPPPTPGFLPTTSVERSTKIARTRGFVIAGSTIGLSLVLVVLILRCLYAKATKKRKVEKYVSFTEQISPILLPDLPATARNSVCLSPDLLVGIKFSLLNYSAEAIRTATKGFSEEKKSTCCRVYMGTIGSVGVMIRETRFESARRVVDAHSKINHVNIVKLLGACYNGDKDKDNDRDEVSWSYLVFESPGNNGCLRDCLSNSSSPPLRWPHRVRIAFDIATGLRYLHCFIVPSCAHMNIHSRNVFVTSDFRAKLGEIGSDNSKPPVKKDDVFAFGIVLLELISGREGESLGEYFGVGCFEELSGFVDRSLGDDYSLPEALCLAVLAKALAVLAKACLEDDCLKRPSIDDITKVLSRMV